MEDDGTNMIKYLYDASGVCGFIYQGEAYYYQKNILGDVVRILSNTGNVVGEYFYDAWGNTIILNENSSPTSDSNDIACINKIRYRGYYFDSETNLYYLVSRYYDPTICRFINADEIDYIDPSAIGGLNLYAYCYNNPANYVDPSGHFALSSFLIGLGIAALIGAGVGAASYTAGQIINYVQTGQIEWSFGGFFGSIIGGAVGGALSYLPIFRPILGLFISGFTTSVGAMLGSNIEGSTNYSFLDIFCNSLVVGGLSALSAGIMGKIRISGLNVGRGSFVAIAKQINTKFQRGLINGITRKTFGKMFSHSLYESSAGIFLEDAYDETGIKDWLLKLI